MNLSGTKSFGRDSYPLYRGVRIKVRHVLSHEPDVKACWKHFPASGLMFVPQWGLPQPRFVTSVLTTRLHPHNFLIILISPLGSRLLSQTSIISFPSSQRFGKTPRLGEDSDILRWSPVARTFTLGSSQLLVWIKQRYLPGPTWNQTWLACRKIPLRGISQPCLMTLGGKPSLIISYPVISPLYPRYIHMNCPFMQINGLRLAVSPGIGSPKGRVAWV